MNWVLVVKSVPFFSSYDMVFGVKNEECHSNTTAHKRYILGKPSETCERGMGADHAYNIYADGVYPQGKAHCFEKSL